MRVATGRRRFSSVRGRPAVAELSKISQVVFLMTTETITDSDKAEESQGSEDEQRGIYPRPITEHCPIT